jgi:hypothetical protein
MTQNTNDLAVQPTDPGARQPVAGAVRISARVTLAAIVVQFMLAGLGTFDAVHGDTVKDSFFKLHDRFALVIIVLMVVTLIVALVTRSHRRVLVQSALLPLLAGPVQHALATAGTDHAPWVGSLHVLTGVLILVLESRLAVPLPRTARQPVLRQQA